MSRQTPRQSRTLALPPRGRALAPPPVEEI